MSSRGASFTRACCLLVSSVLVVIWPRGQCVLTIWFPHYGFNATELFSLILNQMWLMVLRLSLNPTIHLRIRLMNITFRRVVVKVIKLGHHWFRQRHFVQPLPEPLLTYMVSCNRNTMLKLIGCGNSCKMLTILTMLQYVKRATYSAHLSYQSLSVTSLTLVQI